MDAVLKLSNSELGSTVINSNEQWGIVVLEMPSLFGASVKDAPSRVWADEDGVDVYEASMSYLGAFDVDIKIGLTSHINEDGTLESDVNHRLQSFIQWWTTNGILKKMYCPHTKQGRKSVRFKSLVPERIINHGGEYTMEAKLTVEIGDPITLITL